MMELGVETERALEYLAMRSDWMSLAKVRFGLFGLRYIFGWILGCSR